MAALRMMIVGAHPDDCEFAAGGLAALGAKRGWEIRFLTATSGDAGHHEMKRAPLKARRRLEARRAAAVIGARADSLGEPDGGIYVTPRTTDRMIAAIRQFDPDVLVTHRTCDYHRDHRATAQLVLDASFMLMVPLTCPRVRAVRRMPVILYHSDRFSEGPAFRPDLVFDITAVLPLKVRMLLEHVSQMREWLPWLAGRREIGRRNPLPVDAALRRDLAERSRATARRFAGALRRKYRRAPAAAEAYQISEYGRRPSAAELARLLPF